MKALSLWQPWATLWAQQLGKHNETRSWATTYTGPIAVHAAKFWNVENVKLAMREEPFKSVLGEAGYPLFSLLPIGKIIAVCERVVCVTPDKALSALSPEQHFLETAFGDYSKGRWIWQPVNIRVLKEPVPCRGAQGLWNVPAEVQKLIEAQL